MKLSAAIAVGIATLASAAPIMTITTTAFVVLVPRIPTLITVAIPTATRSTTGRLRTEPEHVVTATSTGRLRTEPEHVVTARSTVAAEPEIEQRGLNFGCDIYKNTGCPEGQMCYPSESCGWGNKRCPGVCMPWG